MDGVMRTLDNFFKTRNDLIERYSAGEFTKKEFIEENYKYLMKLNLNPFQGRIKSFKMGIYNYQYYNIMAKYSNMMADEMKYCDGELSREHKRKEFDYYALKDKATEQCLEFVDFKGVEAYFLDVNSRRLTNSQLYEIVFRDYDKAIFHSYNEKLLRRLRVNGVFSSKRRRSVIDGYINSSY